MNLLFLWASMLAAGETPQLETGLPPQQNDTTVQSQPQWRASVAFGNGFRGDEEKLRWFERSTGSIDLGLSRTLLDQSLAVETRWTRINSAGTPEEPKLRLGVDRFSIGAVSRKYVHPRINVLVAVSAQAILLRPSHGETLTGTTWSYGALGEAGVEGTLLRMGRASVYAFFRMGYQWQAAQRLELSAEKPDERDESEWIDRTPVTLGRLGLHGVAWTSGVGVGF